MRFLFTAPRRNKIRTQSNTIPFIFCGESKMSSVFFGKKVNTNYQLLIDQVFQPLLDTVEVSEGFCTVLANISKR